MEMFVSQSGKERTIFKGNCHCNEERPHHGRNLLLIVWKRKYKPSIVLVQIGFGVSLRLKFETVQSFVSRLFEEISRGRGKMSHGSGGGGGREQSVVEHQ